MKKSYVYTLMLAFALAGCTIEEPVAPLAGSGTEMTFCVQREADAVTRAALAEGNNIVFEAGDKISIFDADGNNCEFTQSGEISTDGTATFTGKVKMVANSYLALYPYMTDVEVSEGWIGTLGTETSRHPVTIPSQQQAVAGSFDPAAFISVASSKKVSNSVHSITFRNVCALVKFTVPANLDGLTFEKAVLKSESRMLAGSIRATSDGVCEYVGPGSATVTLNGTMKAGQTYYFCTIPHDIEGLSISLYHYSFDETPVVVKAVAADRKISLVRNKVLNLGTIDVAEMPSKEDGWYGEGTAANPYQISTKDDMELLLDRLANGENPQYRGLCYRMTDDIDCDGDSLIADGRKVEFCGVFDGNGHTLANYRSSIYNEPFSSEQAWRLYDYCGVFHRVYRATFRNLTLRPANMTAVLHHHSYVSPFIALIDDANGVAPTLIDNCRLEGNYNLKFCNWGDVQFGGFVGNSYSDDLDFVNCSNDANITFSENYFVEYDEDYHAYERYISPNSTFNIGGFIGHIYNKDNNSTTDFDRCRNRGNITFDLPVEGSYVHCGGFIGYGNWGFRYANTYTFANCVNSGDITMKPGSSNYSVYASGFIGFTQVDGWNHYSYSCEDRRPAPYFHNCLNKGNISAQGNSAHAAGFVYYSKSKGNNDVDRGTDNANQFRLCINIGSISAISPKGETDKYAAAISSGYGDCKWCWWLEKDKDHPVLSCTLEGVASNCYCYPTINADTPNNRRTGSDGKGGTDIVLNLNNSQWSEAWWKQKTVEWIGGSRDKSLDLNF